MRVVPLRHSNVPCAHTQVSRAPSTRHARCLPTARFIAGAGASSRAAFEAAGADRWAERARAELGRIGGRRAAAAGTLSATEEAIARQVAAGRTNREVAAALHLSARTVEWNLSKLYRKLGVRSRTELARVLATGGDAGAAPGNPPDSARGPGIKSAESTG